MIIIRVGPAVRLIIRKCIIYIHELMEVDHMVHVLCTYQFIVVGLIGVEFGLVPRH